jgi:hypothetical protein
VQNTVEIAISSSKMLQIAREADRTGESKKKHNGKKIQTLPDPSKIDDCDLSV